MAFSLKGIGPSETGQFAREKVGLKMIERECSPGSFGQRDGIFGKKTGRMISKLVIRPWPSFQ